MARRNSVSAACCAGQLLLAAFLRGLLEALFDRSLSATAAAALLGVAGVLALPSLPDLEVPGLAALPRTTTTTPEGGLPGERRLRLPGLGLTGGALGLRILGRHAAVTSAAAVVVVGVAADGGGFRGRGGGGHRRRERVGARVEQGQRGQVVDRQVGLHGRAGDALEGSEGVEVRCGGGGGR